MTSTTPVALLDVNVILAAAWRNHTFHSAARGWLADRPRLKWASCAITQSGFVRLSCTAKLVGHVIKPAQALELLTRLTLHPGHHYWSDCPAIPDLALWSSLTITGQRQITDAYLLSLAHHHGGKLVTLDRGIPELLSTAAERRRWVELIAP